MQQSFEWQRKGGTEGTAKFREERPRKQQLAWKPNCCGAKCRSAELLLQGG
jgi:hypothetical protein